MSTATATKTRRKNVSDEELTTMLGLMQAGHTHADIAKLVDRPIGTVSERLARYGHLRPERSDAGAYLPTAEEISTSCREIQQEWTPLERRDRARGQLHGGRWYGSQEEPLDEGMTVPVARNWMTKGGAE